MLVRSGGGRPAATFCIQGSPFWTRLQGAANVCLLHRHLQPHRAEAIWSDDDVSSIGDVHVVRPTKLSVLVRVTSCPPSTYWGSWAPLAAPPWRWRPNRNLGARSGEGTRAQMLPCQCGSVVTALM